MDAIDQLAQWVREATSGVAFTGAGISTESGIPDFRSPGGFWSSNQPVYYDAFLRDRSERVRYWKQRHAMYTQTTSARPNPGHLALADWQRRGHLVGLITQNIDGLHQDAGSEGVIELHGTNRLIACQSCWREWEPEEILPRFDAGEDAPDCEDCGGPLKSKTISFGQMMPVKEMEAAYELSINADLFLAIGSSLVVEPAASMPRLAQRAGARLVIINKGDTPLDGQADLVIRAPIGETLAAVSERMA